MEAEETLEPADHLPFLFPIAAGDMLFHSLAPRLEHQFDQERARATALGGLEVDESESVLVDTDRGRPGRQRNEQPAAVPVEADTAGSATVVSAETETGATGAGSVLVISPASLSSSSTAALMATLSTVPELTEFLMTAPCSAMR